MDVIKQLLDIGFEADVLALPPHILFSGTKVCALPRVILAAELTDENGIFKLSFGLSRVPDIPAIMRAHVVMQHDFVEHSLFLASTQAIQGLEAYIDLLLQLHAPWISKTTQDGFVCPSVVSV